MSLPLLLVVLGLVIWIYLCGALAVLTKVRLRWAIVIAIMAAVVTASSLSTILATSTLGATPYRIPLTIASLEVTWLFYLCCTLTLVYLIGGLWWIVRRWLKTPSQPARAVEQTPRLPARILTLRLLSVLAIAVSLVITGYGFVKAQRPVVTEITASFDDFPPNFDGMTIALVTDIHIGATTRPSFLPMVVSQINATEPDLIVIAGDLVDGPMDSLSEQMEPLGDLTAAYGVVMTMGNHDSFLDAVLWMDYFTSLGITVLANDALVLHRGDQRLEVLGIHDHYAYSGLVPDLTQALQAVDPLPPTDPHFRILVAHQPLQVFSENNLASRSQISLHLSGHTHGGQLWPMGAYTSRNQPFMSGVHDVDGITVVTSRGVGNWLTPARVGAEPEIILLSLSAASPPAPDSLHDDTG